jgi:hypothetical protein
MIATGSYDDVCTMGNILDCTSKDITVVYMALVGPSCPAYFGFLRRPPSGSDSKITGRFFSLDGLFIESFGVGTAP